MIGRQLASGDNEKKRQRNCQFERTVLTEGGKFESFADSRQDVDAQKVVQAEGGTPEKSTNKRQYADTQSQYNADNTTEPSFITNPMVTSNNNNGNTFLSELTINQKQSLYLSTWEKMTWWQISNKQARGTVPIVKALFQINLMILTWWQKYKLRRKERKRIKSWQFRTMAVIKGSMMMNLLIRTLMASSKGQRWWICW